MMRPPNSLTASTPRKLRWPIYFIAGTDAFLCAGDPLTVMRHTRLVVCMPQRSLFAHKLEFPEESSDRPHVRRRRVAARPTPRPFLGLQPLVITHLGPDANFGWVVLIGWTRVTLHPKVLLLRRLLLSMWCVSGHRQPTQPDGGCFDSPRSGETRVVSVPNFRPDYPIGEVRIESEIHAHDDCLLPVESLRPIQQQPARA